MLWKLWTIWDVTGRDPFCVFHQLDDDFVPLEGGAPMPPPFMDRHRAVLYAFGRYSQEERRVLAGGNRPRQMQRG